MDEALRIIDRRNGDGEHGGEAPVPAPRSRQPRRSRLRRRAPARPAARIDTGHLGRARHRNPTWLVAGVLLVVLSALGGVLLFSANDDRVEVLVAAADLQPGVPLQQSDLRIARVAVDGDVATISPNAAAELIGRQSVGRVPAGSVISSGMFADELPLGADEVVIGAALDPGEAPLSGLQVGAPVELVAMELGDPAGATDLPLASTGDDAPAQDAAPQDATSPADASATPIGTGTVWAVEPIATGQLWVSVRVDREVGLQASLASALDALRIVLIGRPS